MFLKWVVVRLAGSVMMNLKPDIEVAGAYNCKDELSLTSKESFLGHFMKQSKQIPDLIPAGSKLNQNIYLLGTRT